jgi:Sigma-70 region 2
LRAKTDASVFRELYDRYAERIHRLHLARCRDRDAALDLTAETFAQARLSLDRFRDFADGSAAPWLYAIFSGKRGHTMSKLSPELERLGDELERSVIAAIGALHRRRRVPKCLAEENGCRSLRSDGRV